MNPRLADSADPARRFMDPSEYARMVEEDGRHWWLRARRDLVFETLTALRARLPHPRPQPRRQLDVGCGAGIMLPLLADSGIVVGVDRSEQALLHARLHGGRHLVQADAADLPFRSASIDIMICLDVLEHLDNDTAVLVELFRLCAPGGYALFTVPAYPSLWSDHDLALGHRRRYTAAELSQKVRAAGWRVVRVTHLFAGILPAVAAVRLLRRVLPRRPRLRSDFRPTPPLFNWGLVHWLRTERWLLRHLNLPFGLSLLCVAGKATSSSGRATDAE